MFHVEQFEAVENLLRHLVGFEPSAIRQEFMRNAHLWKMSGQVIVPRETILRARKWPTCMSASWN